MASFACVWQVELRALGLTLYGVGWFWRVIYYSGRFWHELWIDCLEICLDFDTCIDGYG